METKIKVRNHLGSAGWRVAERAARRAAARLLGVDNLRGLAQAPAEHGVRVYGRGADDYSGDTVVIEW